MFQLKMNKTPFKQKIKKLLEEREVNANGRYPYHVQAAIWALEENLVSLVSLHCGLGTLENELMHLMLNPENSVRLMLNPEVVRGWSPESLEEAGVTLVQNLHHSLTSPPAGDNVPWDEVA